MLYQYSCSPLPPFLNNSDLCPQIIWGDVVSLTLVLCNQIVIQTVSEKSKMPQYRYLRHTGLLWKHMPV